MIVVSFLKDKKNEKLEGRYLVELFDNDRCFSEYQEQVEKSDYRLKVPVFKVGNGAVNGMNGDSSVNGTNGISSKTRANSVSGSNGVLAKKKFRKMSLR